MDSTRNTFSERWKQLYNHSLLHTVLQPALYFNKRILLYISYILQHRSPPVRTFHKYRTIVGNTKITRHKGIQQKSDKFRRRVPPAVRGDTDGRGFSPGIIPCRYVTTYRLLDNTLLCCRIVLNQRKYGSFIQNDYLLMNLLLKVAK